MLLKENWVSRPAPRSHRVFCDSSTTPNAFDILQIHSIFHHPFVVWDDQRCSTYINITSSAAQGGGARFKNRKPIREGCCESRLAELIHWWTDRWLELFPTLTCVFLFLVLYPLRHIHHTHTLTHTYITHTYITHIHSLTHTTHIHHIHTLTHTHTSHTHTVNHTHSHCVAGTHTHHTTLHSHTHHRLTWSVLLIFLAPHACAIMPSRSHPMRRRDVSLCLLRSSQSETGLEASCWFS